MDAKQNPDFLVEDCRELIQKQNEQNKEIEELKLKIDEVKNRIISAEAIRANLKRFSGVFNNLEYTEKRELLNLLIREIRIDGEKSKIEIDLYPLPDIGLYIKNEPWFGPRVPRLPETFSNRTAHLSSTGYSEYPSNLPLFWLTDAFLYSSMKTYKGEFRMLADWGYPPS